MIDIEIYNDNEDDNLNMPVEDIMGETDLDEIEIDLINEVYNSNTYQNLGKVEDVKVVDNIYKPFVILDGGYIENETVNVPNQEPLQVSYNIPFKPTLEHEIKMWDTINDFETKAWSKKNLGFKTGWKSIDKAFDGGLKAGFIVVAGDSNLG